MVVYSQTAKQDLIDILYGLLTWEKHELTIAHCEKYVDDIVDIIETIDKLNIHRNCKFNIHKQFGEKSFSYKRNDQTQWYVIYNWDKDNQTAYVNKIISNHLTKE
jgi:hypothetical protein